LTDLLAVMQAGEKIDPALEKIYGFDTNGLDALWRSSLGFTMALAPPANKTIKSTPTVIPTLPPIMPSFRPSASHTQLVVTKTSTLVMILTPIPNTPTSIPAMLSIVPRETPQEAEGQQPTSNFLIISLIVGISLASLVLIYILFIRDK